MPKPRAVTPAKTEARNSPRVSVVLPVFNGAYFLREAVESVLAQDYQDFELLVVDDGSTDASRSIAKDYAARDPGRVRYLEHPGHANRGTTFSRNLALKYARGELVAFIDADDRWRTAKLADQVAILDAVPQVDAIFGAVNYWSSHEGGDDLIVPTGHIQDRPTAPPEALLKVYPLGKANSPCPSDLLIRRATVDALGGFEEAFVGRLFLYEDQAFFLKLYLRCTLYFSNKVWLDYRQHGKSCTARGQAEGLGWAARRYCLEWFERHLAGTDQRYNVRIRLALMRALRPYRYPRITTFGRRIKSIFGRSHPETIAHRL